MKNYNLLELEIATIKQCINDYPNYNHDKIASLLGISTRTLFRKIKTFNIDFKPTREIKAIDYLQSIGYEVTKVKSNE